MVSLLITAFSALAGAFLGAFLTRQTQHQKWLLERRSEAFAEFLLRCDEAFKNGADVLHKNKNEDNLAGLLFLDAYQPMLTYSKLVRLYLPAEEREEFSMLANNIWALHSQIDLGDERMHRINENTNRIQEIFEVALNAPTLLQYFRRIKGWISIYVMRRKKA